jgi:hypothetical protein
MEPGDPAEREAAEPRSIPITPANCAGQGVRVLNMTFVSPTDKIENGLRARQAAGANLRSLIGTPRSPQALAELGKRVESASVRFHKYISGIDDAVARFIATKSKELDKIEGLTAISRSNHMRAAVSEYRQGLLAMSTVERGKLALEMGEAHQVAEAVRSEYTVVSRLMRTTISDPHRASYAALLADAGESELVGYFHEAIALDNARSRPLAAAAASRLDALIAADPSVRHRVGPLKLQVAEILYGFDCGAALASVDSIGLLCDKATLAEREALGGSVSPEERISIGLRDRELASDIASLIPPVPVTV